MIRRLWDLLQRQAAEPYLRPNELRVDIARAERLQREARRDDLTPRRLPPEPEVRPARSEPPPAPQPDADRRAALDALGLRSRADVRRAFLLKEILEPPLALRDKGDRREGDRVAG